MISNIDINARSFGATTTEATGSPLKIGPAGYTCDLLVPHDCSWTVVATPLPTGQTGLSIMYSCDIYESLDADLNALPFSTSVVTSLDIPPGSDAYAMAVTETSGTSSFDRQQEIVSPGAIQETIAADGLKSRVITAVSFDSSGQAHLLSYGWQSDTTTQYDVAASIVAPADIGDAATKLAAQGYIITAFGGNNADGYALIGTKMHGDTAARPLIVFTQSSPQVAGSVKGYAEVGWVVYNGANPTSNYTILYEK